MSTEISAKFNIGQIIHHKKFDYRGVIVDVNPYFMGTDKWYEEVALSRPPKDKPWYRVIVENSGTMTYVAERHLEVDKNLKPVDNPILDEIFSGISDGVYILKPSEFN